MSQTATVHDIAIGTRARKDTGDLSSLMESIQKFGLLHPIVITTGGKLVAGFRRLEACKRLGMDRVQVTKVSTVNDAITSLMAERDENICRKDMIPEELYDLGESIAAIEKPAAKERQAKHGGTAPGKRKNTCGNFPQVITSRSRDRVGAAVGVSGRTYEKMAAVVRAARKEPEKHGPILDKMNKTGKVDAAFKEVQRERRIEEKRKRLASQAASATVLSDDQWKLIHGDCIAELSKLDDGDARLVFADPPYNIGIDYGEGKRRDMLSPDEYMCWSQDWMSLCHNVLSEDGSLWVMIGDEYAAEYAMALKATGFTIRNWIKWYETFGVNCQNKFNRCSRHIFYCVKSARRFIFNPEAVNRPSDRQTKYDDKRANPEGKVWDDVWTIPRLVGTAKERIADFPTQLPLAILRPIIACASLKNDLVVDPFNGSGTTGLAALELGRRYLGIEKSSKFYELSSARLKAASASLFA